MNIQSITIGNGARIIDAARRGSTISGIARDTGIPFPTVRRAVYTFESMGVIRTEKRGKKVFVSTTSEEHPVVDAMVRAARWISMVIWDPDVFVARVFEKNRIHYALVGTSKIKYIRYESRNMVQVAVPRDQYERANIKVKEAFGGIGIRTTDDPAEVIGKAMSVIYFKCFPIDGRMGFDEYAVRTIDSHEIIQIRVADTDTENRAMRQASARDMTFSSIA